MSDPLFLEHFRRQIKSQEAPVDLSKISNKIQRRQDLFKSALGLSFFGHTTLLILSILLPLLGAVLGLVDSDRELLKDKQFRNAIRVDMVGLPNLTLQELQKIDPTEEMGKRDKAPDPLEESKIDSKAEEATKVSETAMKLAEQKKLELSKKQAIEKSKQESAAKEKKRLDDLRASLRVEERRKRLVNELKDQVSAEEGRTPLAGNIISEGYSVTGDVASDMDIFQGHLKAHLRKTWNLPGWMQASSLSARVLVKLAPNGKIMAQEFLRESGNSEFDRYVVEALKNAEPFPGPPPSLQRKVMEEGVEWGFPQ